MNGIDRALIGVLCGAVAAVAVLVGFTFDRVDNLYPVCPGQVSPLTVVPATPRAVP